MSLCHHLQLMNELTWRLFCAQLCLTNIVSVLSPDPNTDIRANVDFRWLKNASLADLRKVVSLSSALKKGKRFSCDGQGFS